jgi:hypothetical protein
MICCSVVRILGLLYEGRMCGSRASARRLLLTYNSWEHLPNLCLRVAGDAGARRDAGTVVFSPDERFSPTVFWLDSSLR